MRQELIQFVEEKQLRRELPTFRAGDTVRVHTKIKEGEKERIQVFEGVVIRRRLGQSRATFTVRKMSYGIGVERIFPTHSPRIDKIELVSQGKVHRARLFYLRKLQGRAARIDRKEDRELVARAPAPVAAPTKVSAEPPAAPPSLADPHSIDAPSATAPTPGE